MRRRDVEKRSRGSLTLPGPPPRMRRPSLGLPPGQSALSLKARSGIVRSLDRIRLEGRGLELVELTRRLLSVSGRLERPLARRLLAAALECPAEAVPDRLTRAELAAARHGLLRREGQPTQLRARMATPLARARFTVVDLETTGLSERCGIVEIGAVRVEALELRARFETLVDPGLPLSPAIQELTGIDSRDLQNAPPAAQALASFRRWLAATPDAAFVAHNAAFDEGFIRRGFREHGLPPLPGPVLCTRRLGRRLVPALRAYNLDALSARFGVSNPARHRALGDALAAARVLVELLALFLEQRPRASLLDLLEGDALLEAQGLCLGICGRENAREGVLIVRRRECSRQGRCQR
ncbi:MAG: 3'-5' exonuclease, partial [Myxococcota bacterium]